MCTARTEDTQAGYTLLEVLVVLLIMSLVAAAAPTAYGRIFPSFQMRQFAYDLAVYAREVRETARAEGAAKYIRFDSDTERLVQGTDMPEQPDNVTVSFAQEGTWPALVDGALVFYPNGASNGGTVTVRHKNVSVFVDIDWVSGAVEVRQ